MKNNNMTQDSLAKTLGLSQASIYKYLQGKAEPNIQSLKKMSKIFNVTVDFLIGNQTNSGFPISLYTQAQQLIVPYIHKLNDEQCYKVAGYIEAMIGKDFIPVQPMQDQQAVKWKNFSNMNDD